MEFCPSCKNFMVPKGTKKKVLVCRSCGLERSKFKVNSYKIKENNRHKHGEILVVEEGKKRTSEEQRRYNTDLYGNEMYEIED